MSATDNPSNKTLVMPSQSENGQQENDDLEKKIQQRFKYKESDLLGLGGIAKVYKAYDTKLERFVAIKKMSELAAGNLELIIRFINEAKSVAKLNHINIVQVYDTIETTKGYCIVMEYMDGGDLGKMIDTRGALGIERTIDISLQIIRALSVAHENNIYHRDIKPQNILINHFGHVKLSDFGVAHFAQPEKEDLTRTAIVMGTPSYMSPEQKKGAKFADARSDIYSIGATMYHMLTSDEPVQIESNKIPNKLKTILTKTLDDDPQKRYQKIGDLYKELLALRRTLNLDDTDPRISQKELKASNAGNIENQGRKKMAMVLTLIFIISLITIGVSLFLYNQAEYNQQANLIESQQGNLTEEEFQKKLSWQKEAAEKYRQAQQNNSTDLLLSAQYKYNQIYLMDKTDREILQIIEKINSKTYIMKIKKYYLFLAINNYLSGDREKAKKFYLKIKEIDAPDPTIKFILKKLELPTP